MINALKFLFFATALFIGMIAFLELGRHIGKWRNQHDPYGADEGIKAVDAAVFALFGLLLAFTFSGAASRFDHRRELTTMEANAIGTAYLRIDLLPAQSQPALRKLFRQYVESRIARFQDYANEEASQADYRLGLKLQGDIWKLAVAAVKSADNPQVAQQILPALNDMIDISTTRLVATQTHPPNIIYIMLYGLGLVVAMLAGYGMSASHARQWLHVLAFSGAITMTIYVIMDIEHPRSGLIRVDAIDQLLVDALDSMKQN
jgi:hypothetical protein